MSTIQPGRQIFLDPEDPLYPTSDGKPMADSTQQFRWIVTIKEGLESLFADRPDVFVAGDLLWYATQGEPSDAMAPDVLIVFGRPKGDRRSYREWVEDGVVPQVVFEVASPSNTKAEMDLKLLRYESRGVEEYYFYDPKRGVLKGWLRGPDGLRTIRKTTGWTSPRLGVKFDCPRREDGLIITRPDGQAFRTFLELAKDEEAARRIAKAERRKRRKAEREVEAERQRADSEHDRAERLAAKLRELGVDPD